MDIVDKLDALADRMCAEGMLCRAAVVRAAAGEITLLRLQLNTLERLQRMKDIRCLTP